MTTFMGGGSGRGGELDKEGILGCELEHTLEMVSPAPSLPPPPGVHDTPQSRERTGIKRAVLDIQKLLVEAAIGRNGCMVDQPALGQALCLLTAGYVAF